MVYANSLFLLTFKSKYDKSIARGDKQMIIKIDNRTGIERFKEVICGTKPHCVFCDKNNIKTKVEQSVKKYDSDCLTFFCDNFKLQ